MATQQQGFVPAPGAGAPDRLRAGMAAAPALPALLAAAPAALADQIADASKQFSEAAYPVAKKIDWGNTPTIAKYLSEESAKNPKGVAAAVDKLLEVGLTMDPALVKAAVKVHEKAIRGAAGDPNLVASQADFAAVNEALARMIASADKEKFFYLLSAFPENKELQMKLFSENDPAEAKAAYDAFVKLTDAVRAASTDGATPFQTAAAAGGPIGDAAKKFSDASYPLVSKIDWGNTPLISKYIAEVSAKDPKATAKAFANTLEVGASMDMKLVGAAVAAHDKAIDGALSNPGFVASKADWAAVNDALARMIGSADPAKFKAILTAFPGNADLQMALFAANNANDAKAAYETFVALTKAVAR
ncbi:hypothetical protein ACFOYZ_29220 [Neobacillus cucumis]